MTTKRLSYTLPFTKMHALGNDFVIINAQAQPIDITQLPLAQLSDRRFGIGFDQLLIIGPSSQADFFCSIFNADGSIAEQCGNGLRCVARLLHEEGASDTSLRLETTAGIFPLLIKDYEHIQMGMGVPIVQEDALKLTSPSSQSTLFFNIVTLGNPHAIIKVSSFKSVHPKTWQQQISSLPNFTAGVNIGMVQVLGPRHIKLKTLERGAGETPACGSNAGAAAVAGMTQGWIDEGRIIVQYQRGALEVDWYGSGTPVYVTGPASRAFSGKVAIQAEKQKEHFYSKTIAKEDCP